MILKNWFFSNMNRYTKIWSVCSKKRDEDDFTFVSATDKVFQKFEILMRLIFKQIEEEDQGK
jgi:hypothetical protein